LADRTSAPSSSKTFKIDMNTSLEIDNLKDGSKLSIANGPRYGIVSTSVAGSRDNTATVTYTPNKGFTGRDKFTYKTTDAHGAESSIVPVDITVNDVHIPKGVIIVLVLVSISLVAALYFAYIDTTAKSTLDWFLPKANITINTININATDTVTVTKSAHTNTLSVPQIPRFVIIWGYIGAAAYLLKVITGYLGAREYQNSYLPFHITRLFIGPALAVMTYFILQTGSFFGLSFDVTKVPIQLLPYLYAGVAFLSGYFVRSIIETLSNIINAIFSLKESQPSKP
jgi:hypothetical protein